MAELSQPTLLWTAFGDRGVSKLVEAISSPGATESVKDLRANLATLHSLLSNQESKMQALAKDGAVVPVLSRLISSEDDDVRRQAALVIGSLALSFQGRMAVDAAGSVAPLVKRLGEPDRADLVREAAAGALLALSESRDGCAVLMRTPDVVTTVTRALKDAHLPVVLASLGALGNLLRLDLGVSEALAAGATEQLKRLVDPETSDVIEEEQLAKALQALWNLSNTPEGKRSAIAAGLIPILAPQARRCRRDPPRATAVQQEHDCRLDPPHVIATCGRRVTATCPPCDHRVTTV